MDGQARARALIREAAGSLLDTDEPNPLELARALDDIADLARRECADVVRSVRRLYGWTGVARAFGITRQAAAKRFRLPTPGVIPGGDPP